MHGLSNIEFVVLQLLVEEPGSYGLQLVERSDGLVKRGTVYVTLDRMEQKGLITSKKEARPTHSGLPRRMYSPTGYGAKLLALQEEAYLLRGRRSVPT